MRLRYKRVLCADGFSMSVQASGYNYCTPRTNDAKEYIEVEIGFPNSKEDLLMDYAEDINNPTATVYGYVPAQVVVNVLAKHGGIVSGDLPPGIPHIKVDE